MSPNSQHINLDNYIVNDYIRELFKKSYWYIDDQSTIREYVRKVISGYDDARIIFSKSFLKNMFFDEILYYTNKNVSIINCNSDENLFKKEYKDRNKLIIYNNVSRCDENIVDYIKTSKGVLVC